jgi:hypothetical protein
MVDEIVAQGTHIHNIAPKATFRLLWQSLVLHLASELPPQQLDS